MSSNQFQPGHLVYHLASGTREPRPVTVVGYGADGHPIYVEGHVSLMVTTDENLAVKEDIPNHPYTQRFEKHREAFEKLIG